MSEALDRDAIVSLLNDLDTACKTNDVTAEIFLVGGAALSLGYDSERVTRDLDGVFVPTAKLREIIRQVGDKNRLAPDWLNDAVKGFLPGTDDSRETVFESSNLKVQIASPKYLLALKLLAARNDRDADDIRLLYRLCGYSTVEEGLELLHNTFSESLLHPRIEYFLEDTLSSGLQASQKLVLPESNTQASDKNEPEQQL